MSHTPTPTAAIERELRHVLIRHLPVGLEGIGIAQAAAVLGVFQRHENHRPRVTLEAQQRQGLRTLKETAEQHAESITVTLDGETACGLCTDPQGRQESWPCPVWVSADLLGLLEPLSIAEVI